MGDRKVVNKYIPADFDPSLIPRGKKLSSKDGTVPVRMMLPFSIQCSNCHEFLYRGRKFNSRKEAMGGPDGTYLGITRWRFYIKCTQCSRPLTFLTDPKNADYEMESGGTRNFEYTHNKKQQEAEAEQEDEEKKKMEDPLQALEARVLDSQRELKEMDQLEEIRALNARHVQLLKQKKGSAFGDDTNAVLNVRHQTDEGGGNGEELTEEEEAMVRAAQFSKKLGSMKRLNEKDEAAAELQRNKEAKALQMRQEDLFRKTHQVATAMPVILARKRRRVEEPAASAEQKNGKEGLSVLLGAYGSDSD